MKKQLYIILTAVLFTVASLSAGCDWGYSSDPCGDGSDWIYEVVTEVLDIAYPDTVTEGDTVSITVTIVDSTLSDFRYLWSPRSGVLCEERWLESTKGEGTDFGHCVTYKNQVFWVVPEVAESVGQAIGLIIANDSLEALDLRTEEGCRYRQYITKSQSFGVFILNSD